MTRCGTHARVKALLTELLEPTDDARMAGGSIRLIGDGVLVEFAERAGGGAAAVEIQQAMAARDPDLAPGRRIAFRIGINYGEVLVDDDEIYGHGLDHRGPPGERRRPGRHLRLARSVHEQLRAEPRFATPTSAST